MDIPQFKDVIQKLSVFKRHSSLFVPVVVGLVGALLFVPAQLMSSKLKAQIFEESITNRSRQVASLRQNAVARTQWSVERERQKAYQSDANQISLLAKELTQRQLLSDGIFPKPTEDSMLLFKKFGQRFRAGVDELLKGVHAGECPTKEELERSLRGITGGGSRRDSRLSRSVWKGPSKTPLRGSPRTLPDVDYGSFGEAQATIEHEICRAKAESASVYINPINLSGYEFWGKYQYAGTPEAIKACWYYQLAYWIIEDIIDTIDAMNSGSDSVFESPVKRLRGIWFTSEESVIGRLIKTTVKGRSTRSTAQVALDMPTYVLTIQDGLTLPWTSRVCNDDIDVVHFKVRVMVSTKAVLQFMQQLCSAKRHIIRESGGQIQGPRDRNHNQITILESEITSIDRRDEVHDLYRYGEDAVVELELICEYVFNKKGYDELKPESVKKSQIVESVPTGWDSKRAPDRRTKTR